MQDAVDEKGTAEHRCHCLLVDTAKGSATAYNAQYVFKNINGKRVGDDLEDKSAIESTKRVEA